MESEASNHRSLTVNQRGWAGRFPLPSGSPSQRPPENQSQKGCEGRDTVPTQGPGFLPQMRGRSLVTDLSQTLSFLRKEENIYYRLSEVLDNDFQRTRAAALGAGKQLPITHPAPPRGAGSLCSENPGRTF